MKPQLLLILSLFVICTLVGCGNKNNTSDPIPPKGTKYIDIGYTGMNIQVLIPDSSFGRLDTVMKSWGAYLIKVGKNFQLSIEEGDGDLELIKSDNANNEINKLKRYLVQDSSTLVWESGIADLSEFHFYYVIKIGKRSYVVHDITEDTFNQKAIENMLDLARQIKEAPKKSTSS